MIYYALLSFALGIYFLQQQSALPSLTVSLSFVAVGLLTSLAIGLFQTITRTRLSSVRQRTHPCSAISVAWSMPSLPQPYRKPKQADDKQWPLGRNRKQSYQRYAQLALLSMLMFSCGFAWATWRAQLRLQDRLCASDEMQRYKINGKIIGLVSPLSAGFNGQPGWRFLFAPEHKQITATHCALPQQLLLNWYAAEKPLQAGQRWQLTVALKRPHGLANPGSSDYEAWLLQQHIGAVGKVHQGHLINAISPFSLADFISRQRAALLTHIQNALPEKAQYTGILQALVVGEQYAINEHEWQIYRATGTNHLLAISGLHITLVAGMLASLTSWCWRRSTKLPLALPAQHAALLVAVLAALSYSVLAGFHIPARRALIMLTVAAIAQLSNRLPAPTIILCWALFFVLLFDPWAVLSPGFWLSFVAVATILFSLKPRHEPSNKNSSKNKALESTADYRNAPKIFDLATVWQTFKPKLQQAGKIQIAVSAMLIPFSVLFFGQIAVLSPIANALAIPLFSFFITPLALLGAFSPLWLAQILLSLAHQIVAWTTHILSQIAAWPVALISVATPPLWVLSLTGLGIIGLLYGKGQWRWLSIVCLLPLTVHTLWPFHFAHPSTPPRGEFYATIFDVGQGGATLIQTATHTLMYDSGPAQAGKKSNAATRVLLPYLRSRALKQLDVLLISHQDKDHSGGMTTLLEHIPIKKIISSINHSHPLLRSAIDLAVPHTPCEAGQSWEWDGVRFSVLHPLANAQDKPNALSCTLHIATAHHALLLPGDIESQQEAEIRLRTPARALQASIVVMPHHGSKTSSSAEWLDTVQAKVAIAQVGYLNRFNHPRPEVLARYTKRNTTLLRSDYDGAISIQTDGQKITWQSWRQQQRRYWHWQAEENNTPH